MKTYFIYFQWYTFNLQNIINLVLNQDSKTCHNKKCRQLNDSGYGIYYTINQTILQSNLNRSQRYFSLAMIFNL